MALDLQTVDGPRTRRLVVKPAPTPDKVRLSLTDQNSNAVSILLAKEELDQLILCLQTLRKELR